MLKKLMIRIYHGFSITMLVNLLVHLLVAGASGSCVTPGFAAHFANEALAMLVQLILVGMIGTAFAAAALVFEIERWSFLQQGIVHFCITALVWMPIAYLCWAPVHGRGLVFTILGWTLTYIVNWLVQYCIWKRKISEINRQLRALHEGEAAK